jgi:endonuclease/exonuclease/phosphatase family metal-dependent hydrolase
MRYAALFALWLSTAITTFAAPLKVVTWNIEWLPGGHPNATEEEKATQMKAAQAVIKAINPDILLCQEVADRKAAEELCSVVPGLKVQVTSNYGERPQNEVIASKFPVNSCWYAPWKPTLGENDPPRGYAFAAIELPNKQLLLTYSVHMKSNLGGIPKTSVSREEGVKQLLAHAKGMETLYGKQAHCDVLVGGDFNSSPDDPKFKDDHSLSLMKTGFKWVFAGIAPDKRVTIPGKGKYPPATFDHLYFLGLPLNGVAVGQSEGASDHNPVIATFSM